MPHLPVLPKVYADTVHLWLAKPGARGHSIVWAMHTDCASCLLWEQALRGRTCITWLSPSMWTTASCFFSPYPYVYWLSFSSKSLAYCIILHFFSTSLFSKLAKNSLLGPWLRPTFMCILVLPLLHASFPLSSVLLDPGSPMHLKLFFSIGCMWQTWLFSISGHLFSSLLRALMIFLSHPLCWFQHYLTAVIAGMMGFSLPSSQHVFGEADAL